MSYVLLAVVVLSWGFSWYAMALQVNDAHAFVSVAHRFMLASVLMCGGLWASGRFRAIPLRYHGWLAGLGFCLFSVNFISFYIAASYLPSGLLSVIFATAAIFAALNQWFFFRKSLDVRTIVAAVIGIAGLGLLLAPQIAVADTAGTPWWAFAVPFVGTYVFTIGNLISARLAREFTLPNIVGQGMVYGALVSVAFALISGQDFVWPASSGYWAGVVYLALVASILAFLTYLTLVQREGAARAAYAAVLFPLIALGVSTLKEGMQWDVWAVLGLIMALGGTVLVFSGGARR